MDLAVGTHTEITQKNLKVSFVTLLGVLLFFIVGVGGMLGTPRIVEAVNLGTWATSSAAGILDWWPGVTYGNGRFVAVGGEDGVNSIMYSDDGITWATTSAGGMSDAWYAVTYGGGRFVGVSYYGPVMYSADGITWATTSAAGDNDNWRDVTYGNGRFVAVGATAVDTVITSTNGITWATTSAAGNNDAWNSVTYGNGRFVAVSQSGDRVMYSTDGITWATTSAAGNDDTWNDVTYGNGRFVAVSQSGDRVMYSTDGITWATTSAAGNDDTWNDVTYGNGRFVAVSQSGDRVMYSTDGITWATTSAAGNDDQWYGVTYGNSRFIAVGRYADPVMYATSTHPLTQSGFRFRDDDGSETTATYLGSQNANTTAPLNDTLRLRTQIESADESVANRYYVQYKKTSVSSPDSTWSTVGRDGDFPTIVATSSGKDPFNLSTRGANAQCEVGNLILVIFSYDGTSPASTVTEGWNELGESNNGVAVGSAIYWKIATGGFDNPTINTLVSQEASYITYCIEGAGTPIARVTDGSSTNSNPPQLATGAQRNYLWIATRSGDAQAAATAAPPGFFSLASSTAASSGGASTHSAHMFMATSTLDPGTFTSGNEQWVSWTIAVPPKDTPSVQNITFQASASTTGVNNTSYGSIAWSNPTQASSSNNNRSSVTVSSTTASNYLYLTDWGLNVPSNATILGVEVFAEKLQSGGVTGTVRDNSVVLVKNGTTTGSSNLGLTSADWQTTEWMVPYGSSTALWGFSLTPADVNAANFGVAIAVQGAAAGADRVANIDHVTMNVYYTVSSDIQLASSTNIATGGASTTAQLVAPGAMDTSSFEGGHITDDQQPTPLMNTAAGKYSELEWNLIATGTATTGDTYQLRTVSEGIEELADYRTNAHWTIGDYQTQGTFALTGTLYTDYGSTTAGAGVPVVAAIGQGSNPVLYSTTTTAGGAYSFSVASGTTPGSNWSSALIGNKADWFAVTYGQSRFVAVGRPDGAGVMYSDDGFTWATTTAVDDNDTWTGVAYGNGRFVAVGCGDQNGCSMESDRAMYSEDGVTWASTSDAYPASNDYWQSVIYAGDKFVAVANNGEPVMHSFDGITWASSTVNDFSSFESVTYGNGRYVAVGRFDDRVAYSDDGITWATTSAAGDDDDWYGVTFGNGRFVAVGETWGGGDAVMYSNDGITWATTSAAGNDDDWYSVTFANGVFVAVGSGPDSVMTSTDGLTWNAHSALGNNNTWSDVTYGNGRFLAVGGLGVIMYSDAGLGLDTAYTLYSNSTTTLATTYLMGASGASAQGNVNLYGSTVLAYNATTSATSSITKLDDLSFFDSSFDSNILYTAPPGATTTIHANFITATGTTRAPGRLSLEGDFTQNGSFDSNDGTIVFAGADTTLRGDFNTLNALSDVVIEPAVGAESWKAVSVSGISGVRSAISYGNDRFVVTSVCGSFGGDCILTSTDGLTWATTSAAGNNDDWRAITYGNGRYVAVGDSGDRIMTSTDGLTWATTSAAGNNDGWLAITYGNGRFVAVGFSGDRIMTSTDGLAWTAVATSSAAGNNDGWSAVTYGNSRFAAVGYSGDRVMYSDDGLTWTAVATSSAAGNNDSWNAVTYGNGRFVAVGNSGDRVMYSDDGLTWTAVATSSATGNDDDWRAVTYGNGRFVAVGNSGDRVMYSADGLTWTALATSSAAGNDDSWRGVTYGNGRFVAVGREISGSDEFMASFGLVTMQDSVEMKSLMVGEQKKLTGEATTTITGNLINYGDVNNTGTINLSGANSDINMYASASAVPFLGNVIVTGSSTLSSVASTSNLTVQSGAILTQSASALTVSGDLAQNGDLVINTSKLYISGSAPNLSGSFNGGNSFGDLEINPDLTWSIFNAATSTQWRGAVYGDGKYLAVGTNRIQYSTNTITWNTAASPSNTFWQSVTYGNGLFVGVGSIQGTRAMSSLDGISWTARTAAGDNDTWNSVTYGNGRFVAVGSLGDRVMYSNNGTSWTAVAALSAADNNDSWQSVTHGNGRFVAVSNSGDRVMYSDDGLTWTAVATSSAAGNNDSWNAVTYGNGRFVAVGSAGAVMTSFDGLVWVQQDLLDTSMGLGTIAFEDGVFVARSDASLVEGPVITSLDGVTWAKSEYNFWAESLIFGNGFLVGFAGLLVHVADIDDLVVTFEDGLTTNDFIIAGTAIMNMPTSTLSVAGNFTNLAGRINPRAGTTTLFGVGKTITGNLTSLDLLINSPDYGLTNITGSYTYIGNGTTSALTINNGASLTASSSGLLTVAHDFTNNGTFINNGATTTFSGNLSGTTTGTSTLGNTIINARSQGSEWQAIATSSAADNNDSWADVTYGNGRFVAVGYSGDRVMTSTDGLTWATTSAAGNNDNWYAVTYGNGRFVAVGLTGDRVMTSTDGLTWATTSVAGNNDSWLAVTYGNGRFVAVGQSATDNVMTSTDGLTWATTSAAGNNDEWWDITYGNGRFVAVGLTGDRVMTSTDGLTWATTSAAGNNDNWQSVTYGNGRFVAVGQSATDNVMTSTDGLTWATTSAAGNNEGWNAVTYANGRFVAVGSGAADNVMTSTDGLTWATTSAAGNDDYWIGITYGNGRFVAVGVSGDRVISSVGASIFTTNASTSNLTINASSTLNASGTVVSVAGNYTNSGTLTASTSTFIFDGTSTQVATGTLNGSSTFNNLILANTSGNGTTTHSVIFGAPVSATGTMTMFASTSVEFLASSTNTFNNINWQGSSTASQVWLRSSTDGQQWFLDVDGTQTVAYADVRDSNATSTTGGIIATNSINSGNNTNWNFGEGVSTQVWNATDWTLHDTITIQQENIDADLTDFPVYVNLDDLSSTFWSTTPTGSSTVGTDIRVTTADNVEVPRELVFASSTAQTGELHFKAPSISSTTDTVFKIWYNGTTTGDYAQTATYGTYNVWSNGYMAVYHAEEDPAGAAPQIKNSASSSFQGTTSGMVSGNSVASKVGSGLNFGGVNDAVELGNFSPANFITVQAWVDVDDTGNNKQIMTKDQSSVPADRVWQFRTTADERLELLVWNQAGTLGRASSSANILTGFNMVHGSWDGSTVRTYVNGAGDGTGTLAGTSVQQGGTNSVNLGRSNNGSPEYGDQIGDEFRVSDVARSTEWIRAEYINQSTSTDFYNTAQGEGGALVIGDATSGQIKNQFMNQNKIDEPLFAFTLNPIGESATVTALTINLSNISGITTDELTDWRLYRDQNTNRKLDAGDVQIGGAGVFGISGATGSTTFTTDFDATTSTQYIVTADVTNLERQDTVTLSLGTSDITAVGQTTLEAVPRTGSVSSAIHIRIAAGGAGDNNGGLINSGAPGAGIVGGGTPDPGEELGGEPNFNPPTSNGTPHNEWIGGANAYTSNNAYTTETATNDRQTYGNYGYSIPAGNTITGIEVKLEASASTPAGTVQVALSWDGGNTITAPLSTATLTTTDTIYTLGGSSNLWGRSWSTSEFTNGNFGIRLVGQPSGGNTVQVDAIQVRVYHATTGGGGGGGTGEL